jgi:predicted Fe-Mo cluster-binding NifX family protein
MKIAVPVKMNRVNPAVAPLFGKAKWFAFIEDGKVDILANPAHGGRAVVEWLSNEGVDTIIFQEMGTLPYEMIKAKGNISLYHAGYDRVTLDEVLKKHDENNLPKIDDSNIAEIIDRHEGKHSHDHAHHAH